MNTRRLARLASWEDGVPICTSLPLRIGQSTATSNGGDGCNMPGRKCGQGEGVSVGHSGVGVKCLLINELGVAGRSVVDGDVCRAEREVERG
jgi:hypothetical protein